MTFEPANDLLSAAMLCELLQSTPAAIERAVTREGVEPVRRVNGVCYFAADAVDAIRRSLDPALRPESLAGALLPPQTMC